MLNVVPEESESKETGGGDRRGSLYSRACDELRNVEELFTPSAPDLKSAG